MVSGARLLQENNTGSISGVIDVGVRFGTDFFVDVLPDSVHYLFEPVVDCYPKIHELYSRKNIEYSLFEVAHY